MHPLVSNTNPAIQLARIHRLLAAFNDHNVVACTQPLASNVSWNRGDVASIEGRNRLSAQLQNFFAAFPDAVLTAVQVQAFPPDAVLVEWTLEATHLAEWWIPDAAPVPASHRAVRVVGADILSFNADQEIASSEACIDSAALFPPFDALTEPLSWRDLAERYTAAWNSRDPTRVAAFFSPHGSLRVNGAPPAVGTVAIADVAASFMTAFPDLVLHFDGLHQYGDRAVYLWIFEGTNTGPGGRGMRVRFSGYEVWRVGADGLIAESRGYFDSAGYQSQLGSGIPA